jgi:hypothetical protein
MNVPYHIVIEPQEYDAYASVIAPEKIFVLPFSNLGQGSIPARNWVWEHSISIGAERHWILDDNIRSFMRLHQNTFMRLSTGSCFTAIEDFVDRYENLAMAGMQYVMFVTRKSKHPPLCFNTRVYSCILLSNSLPYRWRGRYNEDTDLSLRILKAGYCTVLFYSLLCEKNVTMGMKGGNTDDLYQGDGRYQMALSLYRQHPDVTSIYWRWNRWQHKVDYRRFKRNILRKKPNIVIPTEDNDYGLKY